jgi:HK97 family phage major capsid protein
VATATRVDKDGLWMTTEIDDSELAMRTWEAALNGTAKASTGSVNYLERHDKVSGEVLCWPIAELSIFDGGDKRVPVSDDAVVLPLRALFTEHNIDYTFEAGEDKNVQSVQTTNLDNKENEMDPKEVKKAFAEMRAEEKALEALEVEKKSAMRAEVEKEIKADHKYRATFNIGGKESTAKGDEDAEVKENFYWNMTHPTQAPKAMRAATPLEESEADEGGSLIPLPVLNDIIALKDEYSLVSRLGIQKYYTDSLTLVVPREDAAMGVFATVNEVANYADNEPNFLGTTVTVVKKGSLIAVSEEMLEDSTIFEQYFVSLCARKWALTENLELFTELKATGTAGTSSNTLTQPEIDAFMFTMTEPWAENAQIIMNQATMGLMRTLLIGTPRAYGSFPDFGGREMPSFMGKPVHLNSNWEVTTAGAGDLIISLVDPYALAYVERRGLSIKVDPYGDALAGVIRYFPSYRAKCEVIQVLGNVQYLDV